MDEHGHEAFNRDEQDFLALVGLAPDELERLVATAPPQTLLLAAPVTAQGSRGTLTITALISTGTGTELHFRIDGVPSVKPDPAGPAHAGATSRRAAGQA